MWESIHRTFRFCCSHLYSGLCLQVQHHPGFWNHAQQWKPEEFILSAHLQQVWPWKHEWCFNGPRLQVWWIYAESWSKRSWISTYSCWWKPLVLTKKFKYPNSKGKGGHLGCSEGFNYNLYKSSYGTDEAINSQGREQMHASLENLSKSMRLMNYQHFMLFLYVFFATTNLHNRGYK